MKSNPKIIYTDNSDEIFKYSNNEYGSTHFGIKNSYITIGPQGANVDVIAHEMVHAEIFHRIGLFRKLFLPIWFDEGVAMQVDYREEYVNPISPISLKDLEELEFFKGDDNILTLKYASAKLEISNWMKKLGPRNLFNFLENYKSNGEFRKLYQNIIRQEEKN